MKATNQKPVELVPIYTSKVTGDFHPELHCKEITDAILNPLNTAHPVIIDDNGYQMTDVDISQCILNCLGESYDAKAQKRAKSLLNQTLVYFDEKTTLNVNELFLIQSSIKENLPVPNAVTLYTPGVDVIPAARKFLNGTGSWESWFTNLGFWARPNILGFSFGTSTSFDDFKTWFMSQTAPMMASYPALTVQRINDFMTLDLNGLTESLKIRDDENQENDPNSFARLIVAYLMEYSKTVSQVECSPMPFTLGELFCPLNIVFINTERHSKAKPAEIDAEWNIIKTAIQQNIPMVKNGKLSKLTGVQRALQRAAAQAQMGMMTAQNANIMKAKSTAFRKTEPTVRDMAALLQKVMSKMADVNHSENVYKMTKKTYLKPNRRDPDNYNLMGVSTSTKYHPDIHLYIDTSGSISERDYAASMKMCIIMAKKLNVNLYFNSFSDILSQCTKLNVKDKVTGQVYKEFQKVPKVTGGTDFSLVWHYINRSKTRKRELSILVTDFGYWAPNEFIEHPKNLYYIPCANMDWKYICGAAENFVESAEHNDPLIRKHLLF